MWDTKSPPPHHKWSEGIKMWPTKNHFAIMWFCSSRVLILLDFKRVGDLGYTVKSVPPQNWLRTIVNGNGYFNSKWFPDKGSVFDSLTMWNRRGLWFFLTIIDDLWYLGKERTRAIFIVNFNHQDETEEFSQREQIFWSPRGEIKYSLFLIFSDVYFCHYRTFWVEISSALFLFKFY